MSYVAPDAVLDALVKAGASKARLPVRDLLVRGFLAGALLAFATTLAITATLQVGKGIVGALVFPAGFVMIVLLGLELVTGNFAVVPLPCFERTIRPAAVLRNWAWVFGGNLLGCLCYAVLFYVTVHPGTPMAGQLIATAEAKTLAYQHAGTHGLLEVFVKAMLCNWMVTLGVVMAFTSTSTLGKAAAMWLPLVTFFAQGFEHSVVNLFVIPAGMLLGAHVSFGQWWLWNQIPVTFGNIVGGLLFTGAALYLTHRKRTTEAAVPIAVHQQATAALGVPDATPAS